MRFVAQSSHLLRDECRSKGLCETITDSELKLYAQWIENMKKRKKTKRFDIMDKKRYVYYNKLQYGLRCQSIYK